MLGTSNFGGTFSVNGVPEPSTWAMMLIGFAGDWNHDVSPIEKAHTHGTSLKTRWTTPLPTPSLLRSREYHCPQSGGGATSLKSSSKRSALVLKRRGSIMPAIRPALPGILPCAPHRNAETASNPEGIATSADLVGGSRVWRRQDSHAARSSPP